MKTTKAVITAAARHQRVLPVQQLVDRDGVTKSVLAIIIGEAMRAGIEEVCVVVAPGDAERYREAVVSAEAGARSESSLHLRFVEQSEPRGYGHAIACAHDFVGDAPFLHMVGDHIYINGRAGGESCCAAQILTVAEENGCAVSGVQATRESLLPYFGTIGGERVRGTSNLYKIERVVEKPTPTEAEQTLLIPGLRTGNYLCFFGMHVLTPTVMELLRVQVESGAAKIPLSPVLDELARREQYLAVEAQGRRYALDTRYGLLTAQLALALSGDERDEVLTTLCEMLAQREIGAAYPPAMES